VLIAPGARTQEGGAAQRTEATDAVAQQAIGELRSPYCPGLMLEVCPSPQADLLRDSIRNLAAEGYTKPQLVEWMIARHGEKWRGTPKRTGFGIWAWLAPPAALLLGGAFVVRRMQKMRAAAAPLPVGSGALSEHEQAQLAEALREFEQSEEIDV
jgi:cytochrome c-type biogenesis protein CcmH